MILETLVVGPLATNCYLVACPETKEGMVVDPGAEGPRILAVAARAGIRIRYIVNTHAHMDHCGANGEVKEATGAELLIHEEDAAYLRQVGPNIFLFGEDFKKSPPPDRTLKGGETIVVGRLTFEVVHTPGHTPGGICLKGEGALFSGDTLFAGSIGRTDFPGGSFEQLIRSIRDKLFTLPEDLSVYPGHGPSTTIGQEKRENPFF